MLSLMAVTALMAEDSIPLAVPAQAPTHRSTSFAWGAEIGCGIDIGGHDMSNINFNAYFGMKNSWFQLLGAGAGVDMMMSNSCRCFPVFAVCRTAFGVKNPRCFAEVRLGGAYSSFDGDYSCWGAYVAPAIGFNLAVGRSYRSYIILSYVYNDVDYPGINPDYGEIHGLNYANLSIGVTF